MWEILSTLMHKTGRVYDKPSHRATMEGILFRMRTGVPWRDVPDSFGDWSAIYRRFNLWSKKGILEFVFNSLKDDADFEWSFIDGSIVKAHQHSTGAATDENEGIGKSVAGNTTKIHLAVDSYGFPYEISLTGGEVHDSKEAPALIQKLPNSKIVVADRGYDSEKLRETSKLNV